MCMRSSADKAKHLKGRYVARKEEDKTEAVNSSTHNTLHSSSHSILHNYSIAVRFIDPDLANTSVITSLF